MWCRGLPLLSGSCGAEEPAPFHGLGGKQDGRGELEAFSTSVPRNRGCCVVAAVQWQGTATWWTLVVLRLGFQRTSFSPGPDLEHSRQPHQLKKRKMGSRWGTLSHTSFVLSFLTDASQLLKETVTQGENLARCHLLVSEVQGHSHLKSCTLGLAM